jgi:hypothetical protein
MYISEEACLPRELPREMQVMCYGYEVRRLKVGEVGLRDEYGQKGEIDVNEEQTISLLIQGIIYFQTISSHLDLPSLSKSSL